MLPKDLSPSLKFTNHTRSTKSGWESLDSLNLSVPVKKIIGTGSLWVLRERYLMHALSVGKRAATAAAAAAASFF